MERGFTMHVLGLIVEYNPFHNGHLYHIEQARHKSNADVVITIMSGQFLQRGEPAIVDKFTRAEMAILHGSDLVIELPTIFAIQHRDLFSYSAVSILNQLGVDTIIFGSESGNILPFKQLIETEAKHQVALDQAIQSFLKHGDSYPAAYSKALNKLDLISVNDHLPNNSLGIGYTRAVYNINPNIKIDTIKRKQAHYHSETLSRPIASATSIRETIKTTYTEQSLIDVMPEKSYHLMMDYKEQHGQFHDLNIYYPFIQHKLLTTPASDLTRTHGMVEGIEHRLIKAAKTEQHVEGFINQVKTKRYTRTRIMRLLIHLLLNLDTTTVKIAIDQIDQLPAVRSLAQSSTGENYLKTIRKSQSIEVLTKIGKDLPMYLEIDLRASMVYHLFNHKFFKREYQPPYRYEKT